MNCFSQTAPDEEYHSYGDHASSETVDCSSHAPSDGSIDLSVISVNLSKEALGRYLKKKGSSSNTSNGIIYKNDADADPCRSSQSISSSSSQAVTTTSPEMAGPPLVPMVHMHPTIAPPAGFSGHMRIPQLYGPSVLHSSLKYKVSPHVHTPHPHNLSPPLYSSPPPIPRPPSENPYEYSIGSLLPKSYATTHTHAPSPSIDSIYSRPHPHGHAHPLPSFGYDSTSRGSSRSEFISLPMDGGSAKREPTRIHIPSNPSVTSRNSIGRISSNSIERLSERGSPMPNFHVEVLSPGRPVADSRTSLSEYPWANASTGSKFKPAPDELRR